MSSKGWTAGTKPWPAFKRRGAWPRPTRTSRNISREHLPGKTSARNALTFEGHLDDAAACYERAIERMPDFAEAHHNLAVVRQQQGRLAEAVACWRRVIECRPNDAAAHNHLAVVLRSRQEWQAAAAAWRRALELRPDFAEAHDNLGTTLFAQGDSEAAAACFRRAVELKPDFAEAHNNLGTALQNHARPGELADCFRRAIALKPDYVQAQRNLAVVLEEQGQFDDAVSCYRRVIELTPAEAKAHGDLGMVLVRQGRIAEAKACYQKALELDPAQEVWRLSALTICPPVFGGNQEIDDYRRTLLAGLDDFANRKAAFNISALAASECRPSFNLQFQGRQERALRAAFARVFAHCFPIETPAGSAGRPRIGFVVADRHEALFLKSLGGVLEQMDPELFELVVVGSQRGIRALRPALDSGAIRFLPAQNDFDSFAAAIREASVDLLYYWEVGTAGINYFLPFLRLAPLQCTSWGLQVTTGIPAIDYYLSSRLIEPEDAGSHYTEKLLLASTLLTYQHRIVAPERPRPREHFGIAPARHWYLCAQQLGKFQPDFDPVLAGILRRDLQGVIVIVEDPGGRFVAGGLRERFAATIGDVADRIVMLPYQSHADYLSLLVAADVLLDPLHFGGVNSTYDGFSFNKPIVTLPSPFQRGRYTLACYRKMELTDCVAASADEYVEIAVALGTDVAYRREIEEKIRRASPVLFRDTEAVREHERIFSALIEEARSGVARS